MQCNWWMVVQSHESLEGEIESFWERNGIGICHEKTTPFTGMLRNVDTMHTYTATEKHKTLILINLVEGILWLPHWTCGTLRLKGCDTWELLHVKQPLCEEDAEAIGFIQLRDKQRKVWKYTTLKSKNGAWTMGSHPSCHPSCTPLKTSKHTPRAVTRVFVQTCRLVKYFHNFPPVSCYQSGKVAR